MGALQVGHGGAEYARRMLAQAFGPEGSKKHIEKLPHGPDRQSTMLQRIDPQVLVRFVRAEHPQTAALILSRVSPAQSAAVLSSMDLPLRADVAVRIASLNKISPAVFAKISTVIGTRLKSIGEVQRGIFRRTARRGGNLQSTGSGTMRRVTGADETRITVRWSRKSG